MTARAGGNDRLVTWGPDTTLDALAAQAHAHPQLDLDEVTRLLATARAEPRGAAVDRLVHHHLGVVFDAAMQRHGQGIDFGDLYQEGSVAAVVAVQEYARREGAAAGLQAYVRRLVDTHLDDSIERAAAEREAEAAFVRDAERFEQVEVRLRRELGRAVTDLELAAALEWTPERVELVATMLADARAIHDSEILPFLDDVDRD